MGRPPFNPGLVPSRAHSTWTTFNAREAKPLFSIALILLWTTVTLTREQESSAQIMVRQYYLSIISKSKTNSYINHKSFWDWAKNRYASVPAPPQPPTKFVVKIGSSDGNKTSTFVGRHSSYFLFLPHLSCSAPVDASWGTWGAWGSCSKPCWPGGTSSYGVRQYANKNFFLS